MTVLYMDVALWMFTICMYFLLLSLMKKEFLWLECKIFNDSRLLVFHCINDKNCIIMVVFETHDIAKYYI